MSEKNVTKDSNSCSVCAVNEDTFNKLIRLL